MAARFEFWDLPRGLPNTPAASGQAARAQWCNPAQVEQADATTYQPSGVFLGQNIGTKNAPGKMVGIDDDRHLVTVAGSRSGKGVSVILPNLAAYLGSVLVLDPKGENATETAQRRGQGEAIPAGGLGQEVHVIDPFGVADVPPQYRSGWNPLSTLDPTDESYVDDCADLADALVVAPPKDAGNHWNNNARLVLRGLIAWVGAAESVEHRDLAEVRRILYLPPVVEGGKGFEDYVTEILKNPKVAFGVPTEMIGALIGMGDDERGSVLSTARQNIQFVSSPKMARTLASDGRSPDLSKWKMGGMSVYLCLPANRLNTHSRFFRLFINRLLAAAENHPEKPKIRALMLLDEMHVLGHMAQLETAAGLLAGYGIRIHSIWQDFAQLKQLYQDRWETFLGNASVMQFFGLNDLTTMRYVSDRLGTSSILSISQSDQTMQAVASGMSGQSRTIQGSPLITPDELSIFFSRQENKQVIVWSGTSPIVLDRVAFYEPQFEGVRRPDHDRGKYPIPKAPADDPEDGGSEPTGDGGSVPEGAEPEGAEPETLAPAPAKRKPAARKPATKRAPRKTAKPAPDRN